MPELPEVETIVRSIREKIIHRKVSDTIVRQRSLRYKITPNIKKILGGQETHEISRRAKYILIKLDKGSLIIHLGMSGSIKITDAAEPLEKHDHFDLVFDDLILRYNDPRRFGCILWEEDIETSRLLTKLGVEPLSDEFNGDYLYRITRGRRKNIKQFIMDAENLVGVGNIYASEALWKSCIAPDKVADSCSIKQCELLVQFIKNTLESAILSGGTTIKDFKSTDGKLGYFARELQVYGKEGDPCPRCNSIIKRIVLGQRSSFYCTNCQT